MILKVLKNKENNIEPFLNINYKLKENILDIF